MPVRISIAPESTTQVQPGQEVEAVPVMARSLRETMIELVGPLFLPRQCRVLVSWVTPNDGAQGRPVANARQEVQGLVHRVQMLDGAPDYVLWVQVEGASPQVLMDLGRRLEG